MRVGIVGTGEMGRPLVERMVGAGLDVAAYARRSEVRDSFTKSGVHCVHQLAHLADGRDALVVYVYSDDQVRDVLLESGLADAMEPGSVILVLTTGSPHTMEAIDARVRHGGVGVVDAPGSGGPAQLAQGELTLFVGGDAQHVSRCTPVFDACASNVVHVGALGAGQRVKLLNNLLFGAHVELALEAARLGEEFGIDPATLATILHRCSGQSFALDLVASMGSPDALRRAAGMYVHKDALVARAVANDLGADLGAIDPVITTLLQRTR